ncbi:MAG TPA: GNVR domain-containing protein [Candidatus Eisenbacteria bacterium]|nr:GNVR domain-containing protein [Candidatus Eisenbacteria bacterium]
MSGPGPTAGDLLEILQRRARFLILNVAVCTVIALFVSLLLPKWYTGTAVLLPPTEDELSSSAIGQFLPRGLGGIRIPGAPTLADLFVAVLKSRTVADRIVDRFGLVARYKARDREKAARELASHVKFRAGDEGTIAIVVEDRDPKVAADMANAYVEELDRFNLETRSTSAKRTRAFIQERLEIAKRDLVAAEDRLRDYQQRKRLAAISPSDRGDAEVGARLIAQRIALEVRLEVLRQSLSEDSEEMRRTREELAAIDRQVGGLPRAGVEIARLWRDVKIQEQVFELLTAQLEEARIRETRDTPTVQLLDRAQPPLHKSRPKRALVVLSGLLIGLMGSVVVVLVTERRNVTRSPAGVGSHPQ